MENLTPWKPGQSGNPGGRPKRDVAAEIAQAIFERDPEAIERVFAAELRKGNYRVFAALADRAYGKNRIRVSTSQRATVDPLKRTSALNWRSLFPKVRANERQAGESQTLEAGTEWKPGR